MGASADAQQESNDYGEHDATNSSYPSFFEEALGQDDIIMNENEQSLRQVTAANQTNENTLHGFPDLVSGIGTHLEDTQSIDVDDTALLGPKEQRETVSDLVETTPQTQGHVYFAEHGRRYARPPSVSGTGRRFDDGGERSERQDRQLDHGQNATVTHDGPSTVQPRTYAEVAAMAVPSANYPHSVTTASSSCQASQRSRSGNFTCPHPQCKERQPYRLQSELRKHLKRAHTPKSECQYVCDLCSGDEPARFVDERGLNRHKHERHYNTRYYCTVCRKNFYRHDKRKKHMEEEHPGVELPGPRNTAAPGSAVLGTAARSLHTSTRRQPRQGPASQLPTPPSTSSSRSGPDADSWRRKEWDPNIDPQLDSTFPAQP